MVSIPKVVLNTDLKENYCFGCGTSNPIGLKMRFAREGHSVRSDFTPAKTHQGWPNKLHGGILSCVLDEAMAYAAFTTGKICLTASLNIRQRQPIEVETPLVVTASVTRNGSRLIETKGQVHLRNGTLVAEGTAKQFIVKTDTETAARFQESLSYV